MVSGQRVLVVDGLSETEQVLKAVLEPRGLQVDRVRGSDGPNGTVPAGTPSVIVLHEDSPSREGIPAGDWGSAPRVIIGTARFPEGIPPLRDAYLQQPFHYGELVSAIERLLETPTARS